LVGDNRQCWTGTHLIDPELVPGILFSNQKINASQPTQLDIAPTILRCFNINQPEHMNGKPLF